MIRSLRAEDVVQMFLFAVEVLALAGHGQLQQVAIEGERPLGVGGDDGCVIDTEEQRLPSLPSRQALAVGKLQNLEEVLVRDP